MKFTKALIKGKLIKRYKRFFTDVKIGKEIVTAHCPNTGSNKPFMDPVLGQCAVTISLPILTSVKNLL